MHPGQNYFVRKKWTKIFNICPLFRCFRGIGGQKAKRVCYNSNMAVICPNCHRQYDVTLFQFGQSVACDCGTLIRPFAVGFEPAPLEVPIDGILDLHTFQPGEVKDLVREYLRACGEKGICQVRIIHGKGSGVLRRTVQSILKKLPEVESFETAGLDEGGWGATIVRLKSDKTKNETG